MRHFFVLQTKHYALFACLILFVSIFFSCSKKEIVDIDENIDNESIVLKGAFNDGYFDWDKVNQIVTKDNYSRTLLIPLPWESGGTQSAGIPSHWIDENAEAANFSERMYSRENGWRMVYSNMNRHNSLNRYFALYNRNTGILRFFFFSIASSSGTGTSSTYIGINVDRSSSLFNFTKTFADGIDKRSEAPAYFYSPGWVVGTANRSIGFKENNWYGVEIECAYDPIQEEGSKFAVNIWGTNVTATVGQGITSGSASGSIVSTVSNMPSLNLQFGTSNNKFVLDTKSSANTVADKIEEGIEKNDPFFISLWDDTKSNISKWIGSGVQNGVKEGIKAVMSSGGSIINQVLGNTFNSLIGSNGSKNISKVDLAINTETEISLESTQEVVGWGSITPFPLPASASNDPPFYNDEQLGVWNLQTTPSVEIRTFKNIYYSNHYFQKCDYHYNYQLGYGSTNVILNGAIDSCCTISNLRHNLIIEERSGKNIIENLMNFSPAALLDAGKYYKSSNDGVRSKYFTHYGVQQPDSYFFNESRKPVFKLRIAFDLTNNTTGTVYSFSKYFNVDMIDAGTYTTTFEN